MFYFMYFRIKAKIEIWKSFRMLKDVNMNALLECAPKEGTRSRKRVNFSLIDRPDTES